MNKKYFAHPVAFQPWLIGGALQSFGALLVQAKDVHRQAPWGIIKNQTMQLTALYRVVQGAVGSSDHSQNVFIIQLMKLMESKTRNCQSKAFLMVFADPLEQKVRVSFLQPKHNKCTTNRI